MLEGQTKRQGIPVMALESLPSSTYLATWYKLCIGPGFPIHAVYEFRVHLPKPF